MGGIKMSDGNKEKREMTMGILNKYIDEIKPIFGDGLKKVILYGSYARNDFDADSDIDIMLIIDGEEKNARRHNDLLTNIEVRINLENNVVLIPIIMNKEKFLKYENVIPFYRNVAREGVILYEQ